MLYKVGKISLFTLFLATVIAFASTKTAHAQYQDSNLIDDSIFLNVNTMSSPNAIQVFLNGKGGALANYSENGQSAAQIIFSKAQTYGINPQVILATMQKEESLVTDPSPSASQYTYAMGFGCGDNSSGCTTSGFTNQVDAGAWQLRYNLEAVNGIDWGGHKATEYPCATAKSPPSFFYNTGLFPGRTVTFFDGNNGPSDSYKTITLANAATASLYCYTPHAYNPSGVPTYYSGSYNFVTSFESWFGPTTGQGYDLVTSANDNGDLRQWVVYNGIKRWVPDINTLKAWGLDKVTLNQWPGTYLGSYATNDPLSRLMRPSGTLDVYFVDGGKCYKITSPSMYSVWGFDSSQIRDVNIGLSQVPANSGNLSYAFDDPNNTNIYMADGVDGSNKIVPRRYTDPNTLKAWEGDSVTPTPLSSDYFSAKVGSAGSDITNSKVTNGSQEYQVVAGQKLLESIDVAHLYPGVANTVSAATIARLVLSSPASQFVRASGSLTTYMVDASQKHAVGSTNLLRAWGIGANPQVNIVTQGNLDLISTGTPLNTFEADVGGQLYIMDGRKLSVPAGLDSGYRTASNVFSASQALINLSPAGETASNFIKGFNTPQVYLLDSATIRNIRTPNELTLWGTGQTITSLSDYVLSQFGVPGGTIGDYVTDGTTEYVLESGNKHVVDSANKANWNISNPDLLSGATLSRFATGANLTAQLKSFGKYYLVSQGVAYMTVDQNIADVWGVKNAPSIDDALIREFLPINVMTRFAKSSLNNDSRLFVVDNGVLYHLSPGQAVNLGLTSNQMLMSINPPLITSSITEWTYFVVQDSAHIEYVIDGGVKRPFSSVVVQNFWTNNGGLSVSQMTNGFLNLLPTGSSIERAIKGSGSNLYAAQNMTKRWIQSWTSYQSGYAPYVQVSDTLLNVLPNGSNIP